MLQPMPGDTLPIALSFLEAHPDWYIFPIRRLEKIPPCFPDNLNLASNDPAQIRAWHKNYLGCNWGLSLKKSGLIVVDVDLKEGKNGQETLDRIELENGELPQTLTARSPSGGLHFYYTEANGVKFRSALGKAGFGDSIDCPNYVLVPGCWLSSGGCYEIIFDAPVAETPAWFADYLKESEPVESDQTPETDLDDPLNVNWYTNWLRYDAPPSVQNRNGDSTLLFVAGMGKDKAISQPKIIELISIHYNITAEERVARNEMDGRPPYKVNADGTLKEPVEVNGSYCEPLWGTTDDENSADSLPIKVRNAWQYLRNYRPGATTPQAAFESDDAMLTDDDESRGLDGYPSQALRAVIEQSYTVRPGTVFKLPDKTYPKQDGTIVTVPGKEYVAKGGSYTFGEPFNPVAEAEKERTNAVKDPAEQGEELVARDYPSDSPNFEEPADPVPDDRDSLAEPVALETVPDWEQPETEVLETFPPSPFAGDTNRKLGFNENPADVPDEFFNEKTGARGPKPSTINQLCNVWVWVTGIERFVYRKNPTIRWKSSQFDSEYNYMADKVASLAKALFKGRDQLRRFKTLTFRPGCPETLGEAYNCWRPSDIVPVEGDTTMWDTHMKFLFENERDRNLVLDWMAWILQNPTKKPNHALLILGRNTGTGKSFVARTLEQLIGVDNTQRPKNTSMGGEFNSWMMNCRLCIIEEVMQTNRRENINAMRDLITEPRIEVNMKGIPAFLIDNVVCILGISNHPDALPIDAKERRWMIVETLAVRREPSYYTPYLNMLERRDKVLLGAIQYQLLSRSVDATFGVQAAPETDAKRQMIDFARTDADTWLIESAMREPFVVNGVPRRVISVDEIVECMPPNLRNEKRTATVVIPNFLLYGLSNIPGLKFKAGRKIPYARIKKDRKSLYVLDGSALSNEMAAAQYTRERSGAKEAAKIENDRDEIGVE